MISVLIFSVFSKILIIIIIGGFMPLTALTFLKVMVDNKKVEYQKALDDMNIHSSRKVEDSYSASKFFLPVLFSTTICLLAISYFTFAEQFASGINDNLLLTGAFFGEGNKQLIYQSISVLAMAFLGGFLWSAQNIIRRLIAYDLSPNVYYSAGIRIILASVVALVLSFVIGAESSTNVLSFKSSLGAISFLTGMFPERVLSYLINLYKHLVSPDKLNDEALSLYKIEGMSMQHKERLNEMGIDNVQNLSECSLTKLLIETPFGARLLLDWIGQAKLLCYVKENITELRNVGIRSIFDLIKVKKSAAQIQEIAEAAGIKSPLLQNVYEQVANDTDIQALYNFRFEKSPAGNEKDMKEINKPVEANIEN
jgi:hypothetical protein